MSRPERTGYGAGQMKAWLMSGAHPIFRLPPESLQMPFLDDVV